MKRREFIKTGAMAAAATVGAQADRELERLLAELDRLGLAEDTLVIFTSDHGEMCGSHRLQAKGPFVYQENNNVPLVVRWPGVAPEGRATDALAQSPDLVPTLLDLLGEPTPEPLPGKSLAPLVLDPAAPGVNDHVLMAMGMRLNQGDSPNPLVAAAMRSVIGTDTIDAPIQIRAIHDGRVKFARYFDEGLADDYELYDLQADPLELQNLSGRPEHRALEQAMAEKLAQAVAQEMAPIPKDLMGR